MANEGIFQHPADNVVATGTLTLPSGTEDPDYPITNLQGADVYRPAKLTSTTGAFLWAFTGSPGQRIDLVALNNHNLDEGLEVRFQMNDTDSWGSPTVNALITIPAWETHGQVVRPLRPWVDLTQVAGYSASGFAYARLVIVGTNSHAVALCPPWFGETKRTLTVNYETPFRRLDRHPAVASRTDAGVETIYDRLARWRRFNGRVPMWAIADYIAWHQAAGGRYSPVLWIPDPTINDAWWCRFASDDHEVETLTPLADYHTAVLELEEIAPGLPL